MTIDLAMALTKEMLWTALLVCAPVLGVGLLVGVLVSIVQVITQIQEMSLTFIPKMVAVAITIIVLGSWMLGVITQFATTLIKHIPELI